MWRMNGIRLINHSPRPSTDAPNHDDMKTPIMKMNVMEVMKPSPEKEVRLVHHFSFTQKMQSFYFIS